MIYMGTFCNTKNAITSRRTWGLRMKERHYSLELRPKTESAALFSGTCRVLPLLLVSPQIVRRILMDNGLSVCATTIHLAATYKLLSAKHFAKLLTVRASLRKDRLRPWEVPETRRESVPGRPHGKTVSLSPKFALTLFTCALSSGTSSSSLSAR